MEECLAKNLIKEANFSIFFPDSSQMMLKLGWNVRWVEILWNLKILMMSYLFRKYDVIIVIGVRGNLRLLISNLKSKVQYLFEILRKCHLTSLRSWLLALHSLMNSLPWQQWMTCLQSFNFKNFLDNFLKMTLVW